MQKVIIKGSGDYIQYYSNSCGDIFNPLQKDEHGVPKTIEVEDLPIELQEAYKFQTECGNFRTYIVDIEGEYGIALVAEYDEEFCTKTWSSMDEAADALCSILEICIVENAKVFLNTECSLEGCHEAICFMPWDIDAETFCNNEYNLAKALDAITDTAGTIRLTPDMFITA